MLNSNETVSFAEGRDESLLGRSTTRGPDSTSPLASPTPTRNINLPSNRSPSSGMMVTPTKGGGGNDEVKRRSMYRSAGTASSPDLASLVRKAKEASGQTPISEEHKELEGGESEVEMEEKEMASDPTPPPPPPIESPPLERPLPDYSTPTKYTTPIRKSSIRRSPTPTTSESPTPTTRARSPTAPPAPDNKDSRPDPAPSNRISEISTRSMASYVHVSSPNARRSTVSNASAKRPTSRGNGTGALYVQPATTELDLGSPVRKMRAASNSSKAEDEKSSFSNTMRRTSQFFRRLGSGPPTSSTSSSRQREYSSSSAPGTPVSGSFGNSSSSSSHPPPPPVPPLPTGYTLKKKTTPINSATLSPERTTRPSLDHHSSAPQKDKPLPREGSNSTLAVAGSGNGHSRRRSVSLSSIVGGGGNGRPVSTKSEETERFRSELQQWKLDVEGALGSGDDIPLRLSPNMNRVNQQQAAAKVVASLPSSPAVGLLPLFPPLGNMGFGMRRTESTPPFIGAGGGGAGA
ncbi:hypothetical protein P7C70_g9197, partial [Phenoliferia sp. Uapishka_3]